MWRKRLWKINRFGFIHGGEGFLRQIVLNIRAKNKFFCPDIFLDPAK